VLVQLWSGRELTACHCKRTVYYNYIIKCYIDLDGFFAVMKAVENGCEKWNFEFQESVKILDWSQ
jgi:hypothetical protein